MPDVVQHQKPSVVWRRAGEIVAGSALGFLIWSLVGPGMIGWWYEPPSKDAFSCAGSVRAALEKFVFMQLVSALIGAILIGLVLFLGRRWWSKRRPAGDTPAPSTPPPKP